MPKGPAPRPASERFAAKLQPSGSGCLLWTGAVGSHGYGNFYDGERYLTAHRFAYEQIHGPIEGGKRGPVVMHSCDERLCCEPSHLSLADHATNHADCRAKDRGPQYRRRLSPDQEAEARRMVAEGASQKSAAAALRVSQSTISRTLRIGR